LREAGIVPAGGWWARARILCRPGAICGARYLRYAGPGPL